MWFVVLMTSVLLRGGGMRQASPSALLDCSHAIWSWGLCGFQQHPGMGSTWDTVATGSSGFSWELQKDRSRVSQLL